MNYSDQILFFFGAIGAFNSLMLSFYLLLRKSYNSFNNRIFGLFLLILSLRVLKSLFYAFSTEAPVWFLQSGPAFFLFIGPVFLTYVSSKIELASFWFKHWKYHLLIWCVVVIGLMFFLPFSQYVVLNKQVLLPIINLQWLVYVIASLFMIGSKIDFKKTIDLNQRWLLGLSVSLLILWLCYFSLGFDYFVSVPICYSILFYTYFLFFIFNRKVKEQVFSKIKKNKSHNDAPELMIKLKELVLTENLYKDRNIKIADLANKMEVPSHKLSQVINEATGSHFVDFINKYRVEAAKQLLEDRSLYTIEAIGNLSGFNSKSAFYKAFKKQTGTTPAKYTPKN